MLDGSSRRRPGEPESTLGDRTHAPLSSAEAKRFRFRLVSIEIKLSYLQTGAWMWVGGIGGGGEGGRRGQRIVVVRGGDRVRLSVVPIFSAAKDKR